MIDKLKKIYLKENLSKKDLINLFEQIFELQLHKNYHILYTFYINIFDKECEQKSLIIKKENKSRKINSGRLNVVISSINNFDFEVSEKMDLLFYYYDITKLFNISSTETVRKIEEDELFSEGKEFALIIKVSEGW
jgi:hypothetical protein